MLRRLKVRTRLVAVIALPLVLLLAVAGPEALQRRDRAAEADQAAALAAQGEDLDAAANALQIERILSSAVRAGAGDQAGRALVDQRAITDGAVDRAERALSLVADRAPALAPATSHATALLAGLTDIRTETNTARSIVPWVDPFAPVLDALLGLQEGLGSLVAEAGVGSELAQAALVARTKDAAAAQAAQLAAATAWGELRGDQAGILAGLRADELAYRTAYLVAAPTAERVARRAEVQRGAVTTAGRVVDSVIDGGALEAAGRLDDWLDLGGQRQVVLREVEAARVGDAVARADALGDTSRRASTAYAGLAGIGLLVALGLALLAARSITRPLRRLTDAADHLAEERLPKLVDALRHPGDEDERYLSATIEPIEVRSDDELAHLARAFNAVQAVAVDVAAEQADLLRKGISDLYVNLARRNQALIERQIHLLDKLEVGEQDPETLENLYLLDHLATRMRRNAESLLVLAGAESGPRRSRSIDIVDVVRAAVSEVEDYERIDLGALAGATLQGHAVSDVAHIVAELLENATHFSPPSTAVRIDGARTGGSYQLVISDRGVGMPPDQIDALNAILRDPPVTGLALGRSLGCLVAARLAARHGITVRLRAGEREGISAYVIVPRHLIAEDVAEPLLPARMDRVVRLEEGPAGPEAGGASSAPERLRDALPARASFDADLQALLDGDAPPALVEPPVERRRDPEPAPEPVGPPLARRGAGRTPDDVEDHAAPPGVEPAVDAHDGTGVRAGDRPGAGRASRPGARRDGVDALDGTAVHDEAHPGADRARRRGARRDAIDVPVDATPSRVPDPRDDAVVVAGARASGGLARRVPGATTEAEPPPSDAERQRRSPDEVRALLSRYRSGLQAGRTGDRSHEEGS
jgi:HAMP domain-containing protein